MKKITLALMVVALMGASSEMNAAANPSVLDRMKAKAGAVASKVGAAPSSAASRVKNSSFGQGAASMAHGATAAASSAASRVKNSSFGQGAASLAHKAAAGAASLGNRAVAAVRK